MKNKFFTTPILCLFILTMMHPLRAATNSVLPPLRHSPSYLFTLDTDLSTLADDYQIIGNTAINDVELGHIIQPYLNRPLKHDELTQLTNELTLAYVNRGFVSSGAIIDKATSSQGLLSIRIVEGIIDDIEIRNEGRLRDHYIKKRITSRKNKIVNLFELERKLQILQRDKRIQSLKTHLMPSPERGKSVLSMTVQEARPYQASIEVSNYESPNVGAERVLLALGHYNLTGFGDSLELDYRFSEGLDAWHARYTVPIARNGTTIYLDAQHSDSNVVESGFEALDIESSSQSYRVGIDYPLYQSTRSLLSIFVNADKRQSESFLLGLPFSFTDGVEDGLADVSAVRVGFRWDQRGRRRAVALRSTFSFGIDALDATTNDDDLPDSEFQSWVLQGQWAQRLNWLDSQLIAKSSVQLSNEPLLGLERFSIGGHSSIRGYRENTLTGDNGAFASLEWRIPISRAGFENERTSISAFLESGRVWSENDDVDAQNLSSIGLSLRWIPTRRIIFNIAWAHALDDIGGGDDLQDDGFHIQAQYRL